MRAERAKEVDRYLKVETQKKVEQKNLKTVLQEYMSIAMNSDKIVRRDADAQLINLRKRLEKRSKKFYYI